MSNSSNACKMTLQQCVEALESMSLQMEIIRGHLSPSACNKAEGSSSPKKNALAKVVAAKQNADGSVTKMFALKRELPATNIKSQEDSSTAQSPDESDPIAELEEMLTAPQKQKPSQRTFALFSSVADAEEFLMNAINEIVSMFSTISRILKDDALACLKGPPTNKTAIDIVTEQCLALLLDLQIALIQPICKIKELLISRFKTVVPELESAFKNLLMFQKLELLSARTIAKQEARRQVNLEALPENVPPNQSEEQEQ